MQEVAGAAIPFSAVFDDTEAIGRIDNDGFSYEDEN